MAVTTLTATALSGNTASANLPVTAGTAINAADTMRVAYPREGKLFFVFNNTTAGSKVLTVTAGDYIAKGVGNLDITMAQNDVKFLIVDSDRFKDFNGYVNLSFASGMTGYVQVFSLPY